MNTTRVKALCVLSVSLLFVAGACRRAEKAGKEGKELSKNPVTAMGQVSEAAQKAAEAAKEAEQMKPVDPVHFSKLVELLPAAPAGWSASGEPEGETTSGMGFKISRAEQNYTNGEKHLRVEIVDGAFNAPIYAGVTMLAQFSRETREGYEKGVTLDGNPGFEKFTKSGGQNELTMLVAKRYLVTINASGVELDFARSVWASMDRATLASLK